MAGSNLVQSLERGLEMLTVLADAEDGVRLKELAARVDIKVTTAHNLIRTLKAHGFVRQEDGVYTLGSRMEELSGRAARRGKFHRIELAMARLREAYPFATLTYAEPVGGEVVVRRRMSPDQAGVMQKPAAQTLGLYTSASGLAMLAFASEETRLVFEQRHPALEEADNLLTRLDALLHETRAQGLARHPMSDVKRYAAAAPVRNAGGYFYGTLGFSAVAGPDRPIETDSMRQWGVALQAAADGIGSAEQTKGYVS